MRKIKYQYSYFIYPYIIDEKKYDKYILKLLKDKHCTLKIFQKEKDLNVYTYFMPKVRDYLFWSFSYNKEKLRDLEELEYDLKSVLLSKYPCTMFEYTLGKEVQGKVGEKNGIFFDIPKIDIVCFKSGICFLVFKTMLEGENEFSELLDFNYKFRDINSEFISLKDYENIRLQTSSFKDIKELSTLIKDITGKNAQAKEMNLEDERFLTYSYVCLDQEDWNKEEDFINLQEEFIKYSNILPSNHQVGYTEEMLKKQVIEHLKYAKVGITKQGTVLLSSSAHLENYTKLPFAYEQEYLYTYLFALYQKIYLKKINLEFKKTKNFLNAREDLLDFTREIWLQEITLEEGNILYKKWKETLELEEIYAELKNSYDLVYKDLNIEKTRKTNYFIIAVLSATLIFNIINFIFFYTH